MTERLIRLPEVRSLCGLSKAAIYQNMKVGIFPHPISIGPNTVAWRETEVAAINRARIRGMDEDGIRVLVEHLEASRETV